MLNRIFQSSKSLHSSRTNSHIRKRRIGLERMEDRRLMTTNLLLDFDGATQSEVNDVCDEFTCWRDRPSRGGLVGFEQGFSLLNSRYGRFSFLDFDGNGRLDRTDGRLASREVLKRVRQDFAPYDVNVVPLGNTDIVIDVMNNGSTNDTLVFVNGGSMAVGGQAPEDAGNTRPDVGAAGDTVGIANWIRDNYGSSRSDARDAFLNMTANFVSHEAGHAFGLEHLSESRSPDMDGRTLMDPFMWVNDVGFTDVFYWTGDGDRQNEHRYLNRTLGESSESWVAVLRPGEVTVRGDSSSDYTTIRAAAGNDIVIQDWRRGVASDYRYQLDVTSSPDISSLNQFNTAIQRIRYMGGDGHDALYVDPSVTTTVVAHGQGGRDTLRGGSGRDYLFGGADNDVIYGNAGNDILHGDDGTDVLRGGDGDDTLRGGRGHDFLFGEDGHDWLYGNDGNDYLNGGSGRDRLYGYSGNDTLDGTYDGDVDRLYGGTGSDRLYDHRRLRFYYNPVTRTIERSSAPEDILVDSLAEDHVVIREHF